MSDLYAQIAGLPPEKRELFEKMLIEQGVDLTKMMILPALRPPHGLPLSFSQQRLWFLHQMEPGSALYNIPTLLELHGEPDLPVLEQCFNLLIARHEVLRTTFSQNGAEALQIIGQPFSIQIQHHDPLQNSDIFEQIDHVARQPFDLNRGPLLRISLFPVAANHYYLLLVMHHIISDNWSMGLLVREIVGSYQALRKGEQPALAALKIQYADFAVWQRKWLQGKTLETQLSYWREALRSLPPVLDFPLDRPRPSYQTSNGDYQTFFIKPEVQTELNRLSRAENVTLFMTLFAAYAVLLRRYSGEDDIAIGSPVANRNRAETEELLGFFVNTQVLRARFEDDPTFRSLLAQVKQTSLGAQAHQDVPFEMLVEDLQPERNMSHSPLFQVMFVMNNAPIARLELEGLEIRLTETENKTTKFDLILNITDSDKAGLTAKLEYNTDLFDKATMQNFIRHYQNLLGSILAAPDQRVSVLNLFDRDEPGTILHKWNRSGKEYQDNRLIPQLFEESAFRHADKTALKVGNEKWSYRELNTAVNQLAGRLLQAGLAKGDIVGLCAGRRAATLAGMLAIFKAGGVYLPLDASYPAARLQYMFDDAKARFLLTADEFKSLIHSATAPLILPTEFAPSGLPENPQMDIDPQQTAYIIYTSGSTGQPKGVEIQHRVIANHSLAMADYYEYTADDNVLEFAALNFDASIEQILPPLLSGAAVIMRDDEIWDSFQFAQKMKEHDFTMINPPTAYWAQLAADWAAKPEMIPPNRLRLVIVGGDILKPEALLNWRRAGLGNMRILNAYGPTEATITAAIYEVPADFNSGRVPIGRPLANREMYILDAQGQPVPAGLPGELYIGGSLLAKGYLNRPELTAERFVIRHLPGLGERRLYRSGDRVRFLADGNIDFLGRVDFQVKIRGFRIELGEIENLLAGHPAVRENVVMAANDKSGAKRLAAYLTCHPGKESGDEELRQYLSSRLPDYMIPSIFIRLAELPKAPSGKINRRGLPEPDFSNAASAREYVAPRTKTEEELCRIVAEILNIEKVGVFDNFFALGGHSMQATQVVSRIRENFDVEVSLRHLFTNPTVDGIAGAIAAVQ